MALGNEKPTASLPTISLQDLQTGDKNEIQALFQACSGHGFFYLDLQGQSELLAVWRKLLIVAHDYFIQPLENKMLDARKSDTLGYEPAGTSVGARPGDVDAYESLKISRREMLSGHTELTTAASKQSDLFFKFLDHAHGITMMILSHLSDAVNVKNSERFEEYHHDDKPSLSTLALLHYPKHDSLPSGFGHNKHTDIGTLTFLLCEQFGLQVLSPENDGWAFVEPRPNHAIINVGDSLRFISGHRLSSAVHRVVPVEEEQTEDRYSIVYFLRMENEVKYRDGASRVWSAQEWHDSKFNVFRDTQLPNGSEMLTGGMESGDKLRLKSVA
ncbi:hypothetical protein ACLMJK_009554 [Lecanora helva]